MKTETQRIGKHDYQVTQLGAKAGRSIMVRIIRNLGQSIEGRGIREQIAKFAKGLSDEDFAAVSDALSSKTVVLQPHGGSVVPMPLDRIYDQHFAGNYSEMLGWFMFALEVNFTDFFRENVLESLVSKYLAQYLSQSPKGSTGLSGESSQASDTPSPSAS